MKSRLFRKYFLAFISILLASFAFLGSALLVFSTRYWSVDKLSLLSVNAKRVSQYVTSVYEDITVEYESTRLLMLSSILISTSEPLEADLFLCDTEGRVTACKEEIPNTLLPSPVRCQLHSALRVPAETLQLAQGGGYTLIGNPGDIFEKSMLLALEPCYVEDEIIGFVVASQQVSEGMYGYVGRIFQLFLISGLIVLAVALVAAFIISYRLVSPLQDMIEATKQYAQGEFGFRVQTKQNNELQQLAESFNSMAISLATLEGSRRNFVANVSHELKTPMTTIGGFIDGILDGTIAKDQQEKYLTLVSEEVRRLSRLVTGMLNMSKIEDGELQLNVKPFDVNEQLFTTLLSFEQSIGRKSIELVGLESLAPVTLPGDKDMLTQVFYNLIDNAVKFTPAGGAIEFFASAEKNTYTFSVSNSGVGIASEELAHIFERFYKTDKSRSFDVKGTGLGLYIVRTIVKMHDGHISAESDGETYTKFTIELPLSRNQE